MLSDWYHPSYLELVEQTMAPHQPPVFSDNNLINGKMNFDCTKVAQGDTAKCTNNAGISKFKFTTGKTHRLRLINHGSEGVQRFSIDGHNMTVIANDFVEVNPYSTKVVTLGIGQRADVLVTANAGNSKSAFWIRSNITSCSLAHQPNAVAALYYDQADTTKQPTSQPWNIPDPGTCANDDLAITTPMFKMTPPKPSVNNTFGVKLFQNATGSTLWSFDGVTSRVDYNSPTLLMANAGNLSFPLEANVRNVGTNSSVRVIVQNDTPAAYVLPRFSFTASPTSYIHT
jgi:FtsP/CotA-like multicopper oxidase with cupredoxin domain